MKALCLLTAATATVVLGAGACASHDHGGGAAADEYFYDCEDPKRPAGLVTFATDEAYRNFADTVVANGLKKDDTQSAQLGAPAADATLSLAAPPTFSFSAGMSLRSGPGNAPLPSRRPSRWARIRRALALEGTAWAHCPTVTGTLYLLELTPAGGTTPAYSALSSVLSFTPGAEAWKSKLGPHMGKKVTLTLARGVFSMGQLKNGPFVSSKDISFTVGP